MNRSLRSTLNKHVTRAFASLILTLITVLSYGQITNCPTSFVNLNVDDGVNCTAGFEVTPSIMASGTATFTSTGATEVLANTDISMLPDFPFDFGISEVTIIDGGDICIFTIVNTVATAPFLDVCDDITVDLAGECTVEYALPADFAQTGTAACEGGSITFSFSDMDPSSNTVALEADMLGDMNLTVYLTKGSDQGSCAKTITVVDTAPIVPAITCPADAIVEVAPTCQYVYIYSVDGVLPCGGSIMQSAGLPSGSVLALGGNSFTYDVLDDMLVSQATCSWTITVNESAEAGAQVNCIAEINVSIDQTCEVIVEPTNFVTGTICGDISLYTVAATLPNGDELLGPSITFTQDQVGMEIDVTVFDPNGINSCWSRVTIEDKLAPIIECPSDITLTCLESPDTSVTGIPILLTGMIIVEEGGPQNATISNGSCEVELFYGDVVEEFLCEGPFQRVISRRFYVIDNAGNVSESCTQQIFITRETLATAVYPEHYDGIAVHTGLDDNGVASNPPLACDGQDIMWASEMMEDGTIVPSPFDSITPAGDTIPGTGAPSGVGTCGTIYSYYEDLVFEICDDNGCQSFSPSYKVIRHWDVFDWCTGETAIHEQIIKVLDTLPPVFTVGVPDLTISTDLWGCGATIDLPEILAVDQCSSDITYSWSIIDGTYDAVLNKVYVSDNALTSVGNEFELIAHASDCCGNTVSDTGYVTIIDAVPPVVVADEHTVVSLNNKEDDGSTKVLVETFDDGSWDNCGPIDWWIRRMDTACEGYDGLDSLGNASTTEVDEVNDWLKQIHFCCEDVEEEQRVVFMVCDDGDGDGEVEYNGDDNCTTAMIIVDVQDKLAPTVVCPNPVTINCIDFASYEDFINTELDSIQENKLNVRFGEVRTTSTCILITGQEFNGEELCGTGLASRTFTATNSNGSTQCTQTIYVQADSTNVLTCDRISFPTLSLAPYNYDWCDPVDTLLPLVSPVMVNSCGEITIEEPVIDRDNLCTQTGVTLTLDTFNFANGGCMKILAHWEIIDQCIFNENFLYDYGDLDPTNDEVNPFVSENGYFELYVEYDIFDNDAPELVCESALVETADCEFNYGTFSISASDECTPTEALGYQYKIDIDANGTYDYPADSSFAEGSTFDANDLGGLPLGKHNIKWVVYDGCGNYGVCIQEIEVVQRIKAPTPYCYLGLSSAVMDSIYGCSVETWATDFVVEQGFGTCGGSLTYLMIPYQDIYGDPADETDDLSVEEAKDLAQANWEFGCQYIENGVQHTIEIRIYAIDENGVYDFCDASFTINDNFNCCEDILEGTTLISGNVMTEKGKVMADVELKLEGNSPELPKSQFSNSTGNFIFYGLPYEQDYKISAFYNENTMLGVSTLDLVLIQRHLLGMTELDTPYKLIAADINGNESISAADLLQLRKLILGLYPENKFPSNYSWRFLDDGYHFVDPKRPFPFNEVVHINNLPHSAYNQNFVAVKIGDVNNSIELNLNDESSVRNNETFNLVANNVQFAKNDVVKVPVRLSDVKDFFGFQFALDFDSKAVRNVSINGEAITLEDHNISIQDGLVKVSWNKAIPTSLNKEDVLFTINFVATANGTLENSFELSTQSLSPEIYNERLSSENLNIEFRSAEIEGFTMLQNEPNPFSEITNIAYSLPENGQVAFKLFDISGKVLMSSNEQKSKGQHVMKVNANEINVDGVLYYQLEFNGQQITKKMILID
ncbi:T9SS type A sorting domain-containing protein [Portibacter lacus]|uniref:Dockerin domain-containing protein n=1 Tax=Portibacter lacus TaxID=1099794 RepID=A0AA37SNQ4_9BACT|nr:T9SS type A sorting domain-containing protein [Portibacter lacus]GLR16879.1 hypothetical protein GCM10007940_14940 [Portibacter lacus]